uniref:Protein CutA n=1 Tax=Anas platyrhynchos platyrhynchos TaxID=8840 RepID=U3IN70_ANAPP
EEEPWPGSPPPGSGLGPGRVMTLSLLMYPVLRSLALQMHAAVTGSYISGTHSIAFINCLNEQIAKDIARGIMDKRLAAYVNILPKTGAGLFLPRGWVRDSVLCIWFHFRSIHPFEIPEVISLPIDQGNPLYLKWIEENVPRD